MNDLDQSSRKTSDDEQAIMDGNPAQLRILIVDDMRSMRSHARSMLAGRDYLIKEASDGAEALKLAKSFRPHMILMDIVMPEMDGITCCQVLKADADSKDIKVIMVTGKGEYQEIAKAFRAGCDDYITKPIDQNELREKVAELGKLMRCRQRLSSFIKK